MYFGHGKTRGQVPSKHQTKSHYRLKDPLSLKFERDKAL
ncbi:hypothetical protein (plasmid) [Citrobacter freundii]|uniref:Uncharacterized protein n=2 Tax=Enterobacteriaceae TaxID=543 RepID=A0A2R4NFZ7_KLEPN|nr:hypothetical protein [Enterobacter cloacae]AVE24392.1 hypothetical protein [Citrobacter freundii]AVX34880.1 hypothetical protein [Klebsiella pneumoniae]CED95431.1 hypothetical protein [Salmonella enterica subsp. enterica serovar Infantis]ARD68970.1 Hypothetical protein [Enterobacter cloacae]